MEPAPPTQRADGAEPRRRSQRWADAITPTLAGLLVDAVDLATFGPIGLGLGGLAGALVGWQLAPQLGFAARPWLASVLVGVYCMAPGTSFVPLATVLALVGSVTGAIAPARTRAAAPESAIDADYRSRWDDAGDAGDAERR